VKPVRGSAMSSVEERLSRIERDIAYLRGIVEQLGKRLSEFRDYVGRVFNHVGTGIRGLRAGLRELRSWIRWIIGILIAVWVTIIVAVLLKKALLTGARGWEEWTKWLRGL